MHLANLRFKQQSPLPTDNPVRPHLSQHRNKASVLKIPVEMAGMDAKAAVMAGIMTGNVAGVMDAIAGKFVLNRFNIKGRAQAEMFVKYCS